MATLDTHATNRRHLADRRAGGTQTLNVTDWIALLLLIVGALNWGLIGLAGLDLVASLFGVMTPVSRAVYGLVGLAGLYAIYLCVRLAGQPRK
ncbi:MAG TPA: DUF378 domain-containing protein [Pseudomonas sp.]|nr:DUF378 domain-containing protein [Pseudomonas sp.]